MDPTQKKPDEKIQSPLRQKIHEIIFEAETPAGKGFDIILLWLIGISVVVVMLESVPRVAAEYQRLFTIVEWVVTILFTIEYILRIYSVYRPFAYIFSFYGIVDLLSILPTYLSLFFPGTHYLVTIRALRLLRVFRVLKLTTHLSQGAILVDALKSSRTKITVFMMAVMAIVTIVGSAMYLIEGTYPDTAFTSIPISIYWAIVTLTTVGFGDIVPKTELGQFLSAVLMILGYAIIAVPTGIVSTEIARADTGESSEANTTSCPNCSRYGHDSDAEFCKFCGNAL